MGFIRSLWDWIKDDRIRLLLVSFSIVCVFFVLLGVLLRNQFYVVSWASLLAGLWAGFVLAQIVLGVFGLGERVSRMSRSILSVVRYATFFVLMAMIILVTRLLSTAGASTWVVVALPNG